MKPEHETRRKIIREWMSLPKDKRQTEEQAKPFAKKAMERIPSSGDPYRQISDASREPKVRLRQFGDPKVLKCTLRAILLRDVFHMREPTRERHGRRVNGGHLSREQGF